MHRLTYYPALRLVCPLVAGILLSGFFEGSDALFVWGAVSMVAAGLPLLLMLFKVCDLPAASGFLAVAFFFSAGCFLAQEHSRSVRVEWPDCRYYDAVVTDWPRERARSRLLQIVISDVKGSRLNGMKVYMYVPKDSASEILSPGDVIRFYGRIEKPDNEGLDLGFDYAALLLRKGVSGTLWVDAGHWWRSEESPVSTLEFRFARLRRKMLSLYRNWGIEGDVLAVVSAVTMGYKDLVYDGLRKTYSDSGAGHLLAVSGLHVGILYAFLAVLFPPFMNVGFRKWVKEISIMVFLWGYAFVTGFPISAVRSLVMFSIIAVCRCTGRNGAPINSLSVAAALILIHDPDCLYDVGFQLSFLAVLFILLVQPMLLAVWSPESTIGRYVWGMVTVSIAAQVGTAPAVMYHFSSFPTYFLLANMLAVPLMFLVVSVSVFLWMLCWIPLIRCCAVGFLCFLVRQVNAFLDMVACLPGASLTIGISDAGTVFLTYSVLLLICFYIKERKPRYAVAALASVAVWCVILLFETVNIGVYKGF